MGNNLRLTHVLSFFFSYDHFFNFFFFISLCPIKAKSRMNRWYLLFVYFLIVAELTNAGPRRGGPRRGVPWRRDHRCGPSYPLWSGKPGECNPYGGNPCCSKHGWCGATDEHCKCAGCINYRPQGEDIYEY